jgi:hypothetical protein
MKWRSPVRQKQHFSEHGREVPEPSITAFIPASSAAQFSSFQQYEGRTLVVSGKITLYSAKLEIIVKSPSQISMK